MGFEGPEAFLQAMAGEGFQQRNQLVADSVPEVVGFAVGGIFHPALLLLHEELLQSGFGAPEERTRKGIFQPRHPADAGEVGAAKELEEEGLRLVVRMVGGDNPAASELRPELQRGFSSPGPCPGLQSASVQVMVVKQMEGEAERCGLFGHECCFVVGFWAQVVVEVKNVKGPAPEALELVERVEQGNGVRAAADAEEELTVPEAPTGALQLRVERLEKRGQSAT